MIAPMRMESNATPTTTPSTRMPYLDAAPVVAPTSATMAAFDTPSAGHLDDVVEAHIEVDSLMTIGIISPIQGLVLVLLVQVVPIHWACLLPQSRDDP